MARGGGSMVERTDSRRPALRTVSRPKSLCQTQIRRVEKEIGVYEAQSADIVCRRRTMPIGRLAFPGLGAPALLRRSLWFFVRLCAFVLKQIVPHTAHTAMPLSCLDAALLRWAILWPFFATKKHKRRKIMGHPKVLLFRGDGCGSLSCAMGAAQRLRRAIGAQNVPIGRLAFPGRNRRTKHANREIGVPRAPSVDKICQSGAWRFRAAIPAHGRGSPAARRRG